MSRLEELIQELCPDGVEYKTIRDIAEVSTGNSNGNEALDDGEFPFYIRSQTVKRKDNYEYDEEAVIIPGEGGIGDIYHYANGKYALHQRVYRIHFLDKSIIDTKFAYYYFTSCFKKFILKKAVSATVTSIRKPMIESFPIPIPPLEVQQEIVCILDSFTELTTELTTGLTAEHRARKQQFEYYCDKLICLSGRGNSSLPDRWKETTLGQIGTLTRGKRFVKADSEGLITGIPCIHYGELYTYYGVFANKTKSFVSSELAKKLRFAKPGDVVIVGAGENNKDIGVGVAWIGTTDVAVHDACYIFKHNENPKFISYYLRTSFYHNQLKKYVSEGKICSISADGIGKSVIFLPPIEIQNKIVDILDNFDKLCNNLSSCLPAEIEARQQQYEYYRDKLLTFKEKMA